jgi:uncharacterized membrane protein YraQ (UPF0718 family)
MAFAMGWEILWPLILGFTLSAVVQAVVSHREMARLLPDDRPGSIAVLFRRFLTRDLLNQAKEQADKGITGRMEGHADMDMSVTGGGSLWQRITSEQGLTAISHYFVMDWASVWMDIVGGMLIAGALAACVPAAFWQSFFGVDYPLLAKLWGPLVGPLVAVISFVCSVGNIPLAAVLWNGGISFGGAIAFIFADLIILPILNIYRKYYVMAIMPRWWRIFAAGFGCAWH